MRIVGPFSFHSLKFIICSRAAHIQAVPHLSAGSTSETAVQQILDIGGGSWDRDSVLRALRAASNNLEQALQYLSSVSDRSNAEVSCMIIRLLNVMP